MSLNHLIRREKKKTAAATTLSSWWRQQAQPGWGQQAKPTTVSLHVVVCLVSPTDNEASIVRRRMCT